MAENMWTLRYTTVEDPVNYITINGELNINEDHIYMILP